MPRPRVTFSRNGMTSSGPSGPPNETSRKASYAGMVPSNQPCPAAMRWARPAPKSLDDIRYIINRGELRPMTDLNDAREPVSRSRAGLLTRPLRPYAEIFEIPGAWRFSVAGIIGRMPMSMFGLGTVLLISAITGKYGVAGTVSAVGSLGYAFSSPRLGRLVDSHGQRSVLLPLLAVFTVSTALLITAVELRLPTWAFFVPGAIAGATMPSLGTMVRARWSVLLAGSPRLHAAFSFESVADELCFVIGPAAVTLLATEVSPASGVGVAAVLCLLGTLWFAAQRGTEPVVVPPERPEGPRRRRGAA